MLRRVAPLLLMTAAVALAGAEDSAAELNAKVPADFVAHTAGDSGVTLKAPAAWKEGPKASPNIKIMLLIGGGSSVNLVVVPASPNETIEEIYKTVPTALGGQFAEYEPLKTEYVKLAGQPAVRIMYKAVVQPGQPKLQFCQFFINKAGRDYVLTYTAVPDQFAALLPTAEQVAVSIKVP